MNVIIFFNIPMTSIVKPLIRVTLNINNVIRTVQVRWIQ